MTRWWTEHVAAIGDRVGLGLVALLLLLVAGLVGAAWYFYPAWLPGRWWPRAFFARPFWATLVRPWRWPWRNLWPANWRRRKRKKKIPAVEVARPAPVAEVAPDELPDLPVEVFMSLADRLAAEGRFAEAIRERLRGIVRELVDVGAIEITPGATVTELASAAARSRPPVARPVNAASLLFSTIWYGQRPAHAPHDAQMREYAGHVHAALGTRVSGGAR